MGTKADDLVQIVKNMEKMGWGVRNARGSADDKLITAPNGMTMMINVRPTSNNRSRANSLADIKRIGYHDAWARYQEANARPAHPNGTPEAIAVKPTVQAVPVQMRTESVRVTRRMAEEYLSRPPAQLATGERILQRNLDGNLVARYAAWMRAGEWLDNHPQGFVFAPDGGLIEGMHRCWAIVESGHEPIVQITYDADPASFATIDQGKRRTSANVLQTLGVERDAHHLASALKVLWCWDRWLAGKPDAVDWRGWHQLVMSAPEMIATRTRHPQLEELGAGGRLMVARIRGVPAAGVAAHYLAARAHPGGEKALAEFVTGIRDGEMLAKGDPRLAVRNWILAQQGIRQVDKRERQLLALIKAWNAWVTGKSIRQMVVGGTEPLSLPYHPKV